MLDVCLLGTGGMMPLPGRWLTSLLLRYNGKMLLVDCGEGTQIPVKLCGWGFKAIDAIFFTHFHADHIAGLPGLLLTIGNSGKDTPLDLIGPPGLMNVVKSLLVICPALPYDIRAVELGNPELPPLTGVQIAESLQFQYAPCDHNIKCFAYSFYVNRQGVFNPERAKELNVPIRDWKRLQSGESVELPDGRAVTPDMVLGPARRGIKLSYCTDSRPAPALVQLFEGSDLVICEGMYGDDQERENAAGKKHMIFSEAARLAKDAGAEELWLTHYSPALQNPSAFIGAARDIFPAAHPGRDLLARTLKFRD